MYTESKDEEDLKDLFKRIEKIGKENSKSKSIGIKDHFGLDKEFKTIERVETTYSYHKERFLESEFKLNGANTTTNHTSQSSQSSQSSSSSQQSNLVSQSQHNVLQYNTIYSSRLEKLRPVLMEQVESKFSNVPVQKILQMKPGDECVMIGTLYKEMELKPNILKQYAQDRAMLPLPDNRESFISEKDKLFFEDDTGRVKLIGEKGMVDSLVTGLNVAIRGRGLTDAEFEIQEVLFPGLPPQPHSRDLEKIKDDVYICLVSGIGIGNPNNIFQINLLKEFLTGSVGSESEQNEFIKKISRVVFVGNSIHKEEEPHEAFVRYSSRQETQAKQAKQALPIKELDGYLSELCQSIPVDIMPGPNDPTNVSLPQLPLNSCLFPFSIQNTNTTFATNPYESLVGGRVLLGTSGQNIENASRYMKSESKMKIAENTLVWRHLAPTAPDTLTCSALDQDPFVIEQCPHILFFGNQDHYESKLLKGPNDEVVRLIFIPKFSETNTIVCVNLKTLDTFPITFNTSSFFPQSPSTQQ
ncbi:hypothetical protein DICPUDRAFT_153145 [Dictyostelium purpureum]|uniref:DNA-directed DNA polymerase n=1 Tax=Dictyostelium purpureum TaxID=5786 RepID=F0ZN58_DICPU|nr:uncharacterized protein DICPUDRAFT_153145 [Dictyostelium purpureum]EGC34635.1 hypothetical protein DICPUDRAFT_153145 [Dictyostelium purpureum]|eukprot:XP_003288860.1 hypothetical protein DICPUDRAFT_153145 [Dictyostelium purpureum]